MVFVALLAKQKKRSQTTKRHDIDKEGPVSSYGTTGCGDFKRRGGGGGGKKLERFLLKNQHTQRKLWNFENWGRCQKVPKFDFQGQFSMSKIN